MCFPRIQADKPGVGRRPAKRGRPGKEGRVLRSGFALAAGIALLVMWGQAPVGAAGGCVTGVITNWYQVKDKVPGKAYFQLVKDVHQKRSSTDGEGLAALVSDLPRVEVRSSGGFQVSVDQLPAGDYFIALQRGFASPPIVVKDGRPLLIKIPGKFPQNAGNVKLELPLGKEPARHHMEVIH